MRAAETSSTKDNDSGPQLTAAQLICVPMCCTGGASRCDSHSCPLLLQTMPSRCEPGGRPGRPGGLRRSSWGTASASGANTGKHAPEDACLLSLDLNAAPCQPALWNPLPRLFVLRADRCCFLGLNWRQRNAKSAQHIGCLLPTPPAMQCTVQPLGCRITLAAAMQVLLCLLRGSL